MDPTYAAQWEPVVDRCLICEATENQIATLRELGGSLAGLQVSMERRT